MKKGAAIKLAVLSGLLFAALLVWLSDQHTAPPSSDLSPTTVLSAPLPESGRVEMPDVVLPEDQIPSDWETVSTGEETPGHRHAFRLIRSRVSDCAREGERLYRCECGLEKREVLAKTPHTLSAATCTEPAVCMICGAVSAPELGHLFDSDPDTCSRCGTRLTQSFYVLGRELEFDEPFSSVREKLGAPTEIVWEGDLLTYVYAADLRKLTFVQGDAGGVWGVFSFDPALRFRQEGNGFDLKSFSGRLDSLSEAEWIRFSSASLYAFRDRLGTGALYAMWLRLNEYEYNYAYDNAIRFDFSGQEKLSFYIANAQRAFYGLKRLAFSDPAAAVGRDYCQVMASTGVFDHDGSFAARLTEKGVAWCFAGENLSQGYSNCLFVCDAYFNSGDHRENLLNAAFTHVGMAYVQGGDVGTVYGAQEFYQAK